MSGFIIFLVVMPVIALLIWRHKSSGSTTIVLPDNFRTLLNGHVSYYNKLNDGDKLHFEERIKDFLSYVRIHGVNTEITELDKLLVASSAVIPAFGFDWHYYNLTHVLLYGDSFNMEDFSVTGEDRNILGMVGPGAMQRMMIFSLPALRQGFANELSKNNTGIHEFVHLLDKADGYTDGIPEELMQKQYTIPWLNYMSEEIEKMKQGKSDINIYGATNKAEFFAVAAEYFFSLPDRFKENHPELFEMMTKIFHQRPS
jgi:Mlc titration factor MtfA (ptsG expression regulator)